MLSRTASDLYWMSRYLERAENLARMLDVSYSLSLMPHDGCGDGLDELALPLLITGTLDDYLTRHGFDSDWTLVVEKCVIYKAQIVSVDERDQGIRTLLNFGHTLGHALENLSQYQMSHGEAVGIGMLILTRSAEKNNLCQKGTTRKLLEALEAFNLPTQTAYPAEDIALAALFDKKVSGPMINLVLPEKPGKCFIKKIPVDQLIQWIQDGTEE